ncbi:MAG: UvrD-helicase domain-containing protein [Christensenellaceae bacterium]|nr:UvrD-helicase domain-containing protein [Christensenellaceae bacterium]
MDLSTLNKEQRQAVDTLDGPLLILAGAGSGKTRALTYRIANLVDHGVSPWNILALTFTNKAAREMRERTEALLGGSVKDMWVATFHSCCTRILRSDIDKLGRDRNFVIYDDDDQTSLIAAIMKRLGVNDKDITKRQIKEHISEAKNKSTEPEKFLMDNPYLDESVLKVFREYQRSLKEYNALDFDDLLGKTLELFQSCPEVLQKYRSKFRYILVDEYQDTNVMQYHIVELLAREHGNICVVGDDDQSIYGWRGADIRNILDFEKDFPGAKVIRLEQNYRSTSNILDAANAVIENNQGRKSKKLWTDNGRGDRIETFTADSERDEAHFVCRKIMEGVRNGMNYGDFAVLYRMNAQSRIPETTMVNYGIPNKVYGGQRFYERKEIKDIMAYLRLIYNPFDDIALKRIINVPKRSIGDASIAELARAAEQEGKSMLVAALTSENIDPRAMKKIKPFADTMGEFIALSRTMPLSEFTWGMISALEYETYLKAEDKRGEVESRMDNLRELIGNIKEIEKDLPEVEDALRAFLENVSLVSDIDSMNDGNGAVALMTLHSAKGLEFPVVFMIGMEENIFPTSRARNDMSNHAMEEERRLCYVGMTRAKQKLYLINARQRNIFGNESYNRKSRFIEEIPAELTVSDNPVKQPDAREQAEHTRGQRKNFHRYAMDTHALGDGTRDVKPAATPVSKTFEKYQKVQHDKFGVGTVMEISGSGSSMLVSIDFGAAGVKRFAAAYAPIKPVE